MAIAPTRVKPPPAELRTPRGGRSGALRAAVFGVNDGLVSNLALVMGIAGAGAANRMIVLAGIAGLLAGAFSMAAGEYISMRTQRELFQWLLRFEQRELAEDPERETVELAALLVKRGIPEEAARATAVAVMRDPATALEMHAKEELGIDPGELGSPFGAAGWSFVSFFLGAAVPLLPFFVGPSAFAMPGAVVLSGLSLFAVGGTMSRFSDRSVLYSGGRMLLIGGAAAAVTYAVGSLVGVSGIA